MDEPLKGEKGNQGNQGFKGYKGQRGEKGDKGDSAAHSARFAFFALALVAIGVTLFIGYEANRARTAAHQVRVYALKNRVLIQHVAVLTAQQQKFRVLRTKQTASSDLKLCVAIEGLKDIQRKSLIARLKISVQFLKDHPKGIPGVNRALLVQGVALTRSSIKDLAPIDCKKLPSQKINTLHK